MRLALASLALLLLTCAAARSRQRADLSWAIECNSEKVCQERATRICGEEGYELIGGRHTEKIMGTPGNEVITGKNEIYVRCNADRPADAPEPGAGSWTLKRPKGGAP